jgi:hypothetical protein
MLKMERVQGANAAGTAGWTCLSKHGGSRDNKFRPPIQRQTFANVVQLLRLNAERVDCGAIELHRVNDELASEIFVAIPVSNSLMACIHKFMTAGWSSGLRSRLRNQRSRDQIPVVSRGFCDEHLLTSHGCFFSTLTNYVAQIKIK